MFSSNDAPIRMMLSIIFLTAIAGFMWLISTVVYGGSILIVLITIWTVELVQSILLYIIALIFGDKK